MGKKYVPSGYQIININVENKTSGQGFAPETDDEKLLLELLENGVKKPILINLVTSVAGEFFGFATIYGSNLNILTITYHEVIYAQDGLLYWEETEI